MKIVFAVIFTLLFLQRDFPDLSNKEDLKKLGRGRITEKDKSIIKDITLYQVNEYWISYEKEGSLHDKRKDEIEKIEFPKSYWGTLTITFDKNEAKFYKTEKVK